jgi:chemotaxis protein methyltransferase CheR
MRVLRNLVAERIGIQVRDQELERLRGTIADRCKLLQLAGAAEYAEFLQTNSRDSKREWEQLAVLLTTCETYFFRGQAHTDLLRNELLPELIRANQKERSLRIWSAGCASGEEAYTIAILLDELLGEHHGWKISILATDINVEELNKARRGVYSDWSFRQVDPKIQQKYFHKQGSDWELDRRIRNMVTFQPLNLLSDVYPNTIARDMNLIICRNVFIYFSIEDVAAIVSKFGATLHNDGYLLTGHGELRGQSPEPLVSQVFAGSVVLQRDDSTTKADRTAKPLVTVGGTRPRHEPSDEVPKSATPTSVEPDDDAIEQVEEHFRQGRHAIALQKATRMANAHPRSARVHALVAQGHADLGSHTEANEWCQKAIVIDSFAVAPQYLLANIAEAEGRYEDAKSGLRRVIYLDPSHIAAQLGLAALFEREGDHEQARKTRLSVIESLKSRPEDVQIECHGNVSARQLAEQIQLAVTND